MINLVFWVKAVFKKLIQFVDVFSKVMNFLDIEHPSSSTVCRQKILSLQRRYIFDAVFQVWNGLFPQ